MHITIFQYQLCFHSMNTPHPVSILLSLHAYNSPASTLLLSHVNSLRSKDFAFILQFHPILTLLSSYECYSLSTSTLLSLNVNSSHSNNFAFILQSHPVLILLSSYEYYSLSINSAFNACEQLAQ